jgi:O-antigen ligase
MNKLAFGFLWLMVFTIPGEQIIPVEGIGSVTRIVGVLGLTVGVLDVLARGSRRRLVRFHGAIMVFVLWAAATTFWSINPAATLARLATYVQLGIFAWLIWELASVRTRQTALLQAYVLGAYIASLSTLFAFFTASPYDGTVRFAGFDDPNNLGATMALAIPMAWFLSILPGQSRFVCWLNRVYVPVGLTAVILTASRGAFIAVLASLLIIPWTISQVRFSMKAIVSVGVVTLLYLLATSVPRPTADRLATIPSELESGRIGARGPIWRAGAEVFARHPLAGVGAGTFPDAVQPILGTGRSAHQSFLAVAVEQGIVGLVFFLGMFAATLQVLPRMAPLERKLGAVLFLTLGIAMLPLSWDYKKQPWFVLSFLAAQTAVVSVREPRRKHASRAPVEISTAVVGPDAANR